MSYFGISILKDKKPNWEFFRCLKNYKIKMKGKVEFDQRINGILSVT